MSDPYAEITQIGRWTWEVKVRDGMLMWAPDGYAWRVLGRRRAERKARRVLARYVLKQQREYNPIKVVLD